MRKEKVILSSVTIASQGQIKFFQIKLPKTALRIIGIELGMRAGKVPASPPLRSVTPLKRSRTICELKLQSCEGANVFFSTYLQNDPNLGFFDFTKAAWPVKPYSHQTQLLEDPVTVDADTTIIQGMLRDRLEIDLEQIDIEVNYTLNIYVWLEMSK
jgi:hypothetical protein